TTVLCFLELFLLAPDVYFLEVPAAKETDTVIYTAKTEMMRLVVESEYVDMNADEFDKETGSSGGLQPEQADLSCVHALNEPHLHEIYVVPNNSEYFFGRVTPFSSIDGQRSGPFLTDSKIILPCCLFIMYSSIQLFQESYMSFSNIGDDPIDAINYMMSFLTAVVTSRYPPTNNQLRKLSNPRQKATINNGRVTVQPIQGRHTSLAAGTSRKYTSGASRNNSRKQRTVVCYNCKGEGDMLKQCTKPKRKRDESWFKDKVLLV
nr:hypothetical protein [Tanacetum cinerariifolium]